MPDSGSVALVTGGSEGIGHAVAEMLSKMGMTVVICSRNAPTASDTVALERITCDVRDERSVLATVESVLGRHGRIDVLVNSAGVSMPESRPLEEIGSELWARISRTNVEGTFFFCRAVMQHMRKRGAGEIVNILSTASFRTDAGNIPYSASKYAVLAITEGLQKETAGTGIRISAVAPGKVASNIWNHKTKPVGEEARSRMLKPEDIADIVRFLITRPAYVRIGTITVTPDFLPPL